VQKLGRALGGVPPLPPGCRDRQRVQEALTPNQYGVYEANVVIEGILKKGRSSFFPKDWTQEQVEKAIQHPCSPTSRKFPETYVKRTFSTAIF
jgi:hypothetical protein